MIKFFVIPFRVTKITKVFYLKSLVSYTISIENLLFSVFVIDVRTGKSTAGASHKTKCMANLVHAGTITLCTAALQVSHCGTLGYHKCFPVNGY